jgi:hypothetical protein
MIKFLDEMENASILCLKGKELIQYKKVTETSAILVSGETRFFLLARVQKKKRSSLMSTVAEQTIAN